jgi:hypothetical protein
MGSVSTNGSLTPADEMPELRSSRKGIEKELLKSKIADSKKRCQDVINRFKHLNIKI